MSSFEVLALLLTIAAGFAYFNHRILRIVPAVGMMVMGLSTSVALVAVDRFGWLPVAGPAARILDRVEFSQTLLNGMLGVLLFAGSLHIDLNELRREKGAVTALALGSTLLSTVVIGSLGYMVLRAIGIALPFLHCLLFGSLIAPTDPIGVLAVIREARIPKRLEIQIAGESLFNDGIGVVLFLAILGVATRGQDPAIGTLALILGREAIGGALFGMATGYVAYRLVKSIDHYQTELLITLALVFGGYALAQRLHVSGAIAAVVAGLLIGNQGRLLGMSDTTRDHLDKFWMLVDEILNGVLFVLVGFELVALRLTGQSLIAGLIILPVVLVARFVSVALPIVALGRVVEFVRGSIPVLTWGGLRGGISLALALSIPASAERDVIVPMTYSAVVFSLLVQGLSLGWVAKRYAASATQSAA